MPAYQGLEKGLAITSTKNKRCLLKLELRHALRSWGFGPIWRGEVESKCTQRTCILINQASISHRKAETGSRYNTNNVPFLAISNKILHRNNSS